MLLSRLLMNSLLLIAAVLLFAGITGPLMTVEKFYFFEDSVSLISALQELNFRSEWFLYGVILLFSIFFPILKIIALFAIINLSSQAVHHKIKLIHWLNILGKWSMLDVFVVALLLVSFKLKMVADVQIHYGLYTFAASVMLTMLVTQGLRFTGIADKAH